VPTDVQLTGDSITDAGRRDDPAHLGSGYVRDLAHGHLSGSRVTNTGVGGDRLRDLEARWGADVLSVPSHVLSVYIGVNDTWRRFDQGEVTEAAEFEAGLRRLLEPWVALGAFLVLVEPFVLPVQPGQESWHIDLHPKQEAVRAVAADVGAAFVPLATTMADRASELGAAALVVDGVHPTPLGHTVIAEAWWTALQQRFGPA
jgi:lysophospholipase L1-like esterase